MNHALDTLYFTQGSCSLASLATLESLEKPFNAHRLEMGPLGAGDDEYARLSPLRQVPLLRTAAGKTIRETGAILTWLHHKNPDAGLLPSDIDEMVAAMQWLGFLGGTLHPIFRLLWRPSRWVGEDPAAQGALRTATPGYLMTVLAATAKQLDERDWVLSKQTALDFYLHVFTRWAFGAKVPLPDALRAHHARVAALPAMARAVQVEHSSPLQNTL